MPKIIKIICFGFIIIANCFMSLPLAAQTHKTSEQVGGKTYLLSIGINEYQYLPSMKSCVNNATLIADTFKDTVQDIKVTLVTDKQATKNNLKNILDQYRKNLLADDRLIIYYSGHGGKNTMYWSSRDLNSGRYRWRDENVYDESIMPVDASYNKNTQFIPAEMSELLKALPTQKIVIIIDSSYSDNYDLSGSLPSFQSVSQIPRPRSSLRDFNMYGMTVINSSDWKEVALDKNFNGKMLGVFTYYFTQGIFTHISNTNGENTFSINKIFEYSRMFTMQEVGIQHPQIYRGRNRDMILVYSPIKPTF